VGHRRKKHKQAKVVETQTAQAQVVCCIVLHLAAGN